MILWLWLSRCVAFNRIRYDEAVHLFHRNYSWFNLNAAESERRRPKYFLNASVSSSRTPIVLVCGISVHGIDLFVIINWLYVKNITHIDCIHTIVNNVSVLDQFIFFSTYVVELFSRNIIYYNANSSTSLSLFENTLWNKHSLFKNPFCCVTQKCFTKKYLIRCMW